MFVLLSSVAILSNALNGDTTYSVDLQRAIDSCREFASRVGIEVGELRAGFGTELPDSGERLYTIEFSNVHFEYDQRSSTVVLAQNLHEIELRQNPNWSEGRGTPLDDERLLDALGRTAAAVAPGARLRARKSYIQRDGMPPSEQVTASSRLPFALASTSFGPVDPNGRPFFSLAGTFTLIVDARTTDLLEYSAYPPGEVTSSTESIGEASARRIAAAVALEHYGAGPEGSTMELGYSEPRPRSPGATFQGRGGKPTELRLAWRFMIEKFSYQGRYVDLCIDVDAATGQVLWTNPRPRDPRLDR